MELGAPEGDAGLRAVVKAMVDPNARGLREVVITNGAQEGLALVFRALVGPGDAAIVENPTYLGALELLTSIGAEIHGVEMRPDGPDLDALQQAFARTKPKLFYTMPSSHNPTGYTMSARNRRRLLALAYRYDCHIVEDAANARIVYDRSAPPPLVDLDERGVVVHVGSFSKTLFSGVRTGYVLARTDLLPFLVRLKWITNLHTPLLQQRLVHQLLVGQRYSRHLRLVTQSCRVRRDAMLRALARDLTGHARWTAPDGGFGIWVSLLGDVDAAEFFQRAIARGVSFIPGAVFFTSDVRHNTLRLCFAASTPTVISRGVKLLRQALVDLKETGHRTPISSRGIM
jgi:DNA-binding transcriptional MocR family regulator